MSLGIFNCRNEGDKVLIDFNGEVCLIPWEQALLMSQGIYQKAKLAEEYALANRIIADNALLTRVGFPVGLSNNAKIIEETKKEAAWNRDLRRALPGGVKAKVVFGAPTVRVEPTPGVIGPQGIAPTSKMGNIGGK